MALIQETSRSELAERYILETIVAKLNPGDRIPSERELARELGVALPTVNKILVSLTDRGVLSRKRGIGTFVAEFSLKGKVLRVLAESPGSYHPESDLFWYNSQFVLEGILDEARKLGMIVEPCFLDFRNRPPTAKQVNELLAPGISGIAMHLHPRSALEVAWVNELRKKTTALVCRGFGPVDNCSTVWGDLRGGVCQAVSFLLEQGRRRIAVFESFDENDGYVQSRLRGVYDAFQRFGLEPAPELMRPTPLLRNAGYEAMKELLREGIAFDAVFGGYDLSSFGIMRALHEAGVRIPEEVAVVGSDDLPQCREQTPPLATVRYPMFEMGVEMCRILAGAIRNPDAPPVRRELKCEFIIRESAKHTMVS